MKLSEMLTIFSYLAEVFRNLGARLSLRNVNKTKREIVNGDSDAVNKKFQDLLSNGNAEESEVSE